MQTEPAPYCLAARLVVPDPANGSATVDEPGSSPISRIFDSTRRYE